MVKHCRISGRQVRPRPGPGESSGLRGPGRPAGATLAGGATDSAAHGTARRLECPGDGEVDTLR